MNIWVPKIKILENTREAIVIPGPRVSGEFQITGRLPDGRTRVLAALQKNMVLDAGLNRWGTGGIFSWCALGSGTNPPTAADTALQNVVASVIYSDYSDGGDPNPPYPGVSTWTFIFNPPGTNRNISEIGVGWTTGGVNLWSRALIKDLNGDPTVLSWLANETLTVTYTAKKYPWITDIPHTTIISGVTYTGIVRGCGLGSGIYGNFWHNPQHACSGKSGWGGPTVYSGTIGALTGFPSGTAAGGSCAGNAYSNNALEATGTITFGPTVGNFAGGIGAFYNASTTQFWQASLTPPLAKLNTHTLTFNVSSGKWGRKP